MSPTSTIALGVYNPALVPDGVLVAEHTARRKMIDELLAGLRDPSSLLTKRHALLVGLPGLGKTMSLRVLKHRVDEDSKLAKTWVPLLFDEENYHIGNLGEFWLECLRLAEDALERKGEVTYEALRASQGAALEDRARKAFLTLLSNAKRRALLLVDRLDEMLTVMRDDDTQRRLRTFLRGQNAVCMIGTASTVLPDGNAEDRQLQKLFQTCPLEAFTMEEMKAAAQAMADARADTATARHLHWPTRDGYWRGLHLLTGGNPRLLKMSHQLMERGVAGGFHALVEGLLDACTPDFKQRIEAMSRQQRRVFDAIAHAWDSVQIADISAGLRMESNQISAQIKALVDAQLIAVTGGSAKRKRYQVADRFANLYCLMRFSRCGRSRLEWFIRTMNILLAPDPKAQPLERLRELSTGRAGDDGKLHAQLMAHAMRDDEEEFLPLDEGRKTARHLLKMEQNGRQHKQPESFDMGDLFPVEYDAVRYVANLPAEQRSKLGYQHTSSAWWCTVASEAWQLHKTALVEQCARKAVELNPKNASAWGMISAMLLQKRRAKEAWDAAQKLLKVAVDDAQRELAQVLILAARHMIPEQQEEARRLALQMALKSPDRLLSILGFWCYLRGDVKACREMLPRVLKALDAASSTGGTSRMLAHFLALGVSQTLLAASLDSEVEAAIEAAGAAAHEALDTARHAILMRRDENLRAVLAPERLALVDLYLAEVAKRKAEMQRAGF